MTKNRAIHTFIIGCFVSLYLLVSTISCIHVVDFFQLTNNTWLAVTLAIAFEVGAAASLASLIVLDKMNRGLVYILFIVLTLMQAMGNTFYAYVNAHDFQGWIELFGLTDADPIQQKRILSIVSGAILPLVALGFIKSLVDYIKPDIKDNVYSEEPHKIEEPSPEIAVITNPIESVQEELESPVAVIEETVQPEVKIAEPEIILEAPKANPVIEPVEATIIEEQNAVDWDSVLDEPVSETDDDKKKTT